MINLLLAFAIAANAAQLDVSITGQTVKVVNYAVGSQGQGTGLLIGNNKVLTQAHVAQNPDSIILCSTCQNFLGADRLALDTRNDLAILSYESKSTGVKFQRNTYRGQPLVAIGNPISQDFLITKTQVLGYGVDTSRGFLDFIIVRKGQITHGFSGGPVFNMKGKVVGTLNSCSMTFDACAVIPARRIMKFLKENK